VRLVEELAKGGKLGAVTILGEDDHDLGLVQVRRFRTATGVELQTDALESEGGPLRRNGKESQSVALLASDEHRGCC
jgi:hypothetical protein